MYAVRTKYIVVVHTTTGESRAYGGGKSPYRLMFDPTDGEYLGGRGKWSNHAGKPTQALIDMARDFAMHELDITK